MFQRRHIKEEDLREALSGESPDYVVIGLGRFGRRLAEHLLARGHRVLGVDHDPQIVREAESGDVPAVFGDASDPELVSHLALDRARWIVLTAPELEATLTLVDALRESEYQCGIAVAARTEEDATILRETGVDHVFLPLRDAAHDAADRLDRRQPTAAA